MTSTFILLAQGLYLLLHQTPQEDPELTQFLASWVTDNYGPALTMKVIPVPSSKPQYRYNVPIPFWGVRLAFGHQMGVGKDTACNFLQHFKIPTFKFAAKIYDCLYWVQDSLGQPRVKDRQFLQFVGHWGRTRFGTNCWVDLLLKEIRHLPAATISDLRYPNEMKALQAANFYCVKLEREVNRQERQGTGSQLHESETALLGYTFDQTLINNGSEDHFRSQLLDLLQTQLDPKLVEDLKWTTQTLLTTLYEDALALLVPNQTDTTYERGAHALQLILPLETLQTRQNSIRSTLMELMVHHQTMEPDSLVTLFLEQVEDPLFPEVIESLPLLKLAAAPYSFPPTQPKPQKI